MRKKELDRILTRIAREYHTTVSEVRKEMLAAMEIGQASTDPSVRAKWEAIPRKGSKLTVEEFLDFLIRQTTQ